MGKGWAAPPGGFLPKPRGRVARLGPAPLAAGCLRSGAAGTLLPNPLLPLTCALCREGAMATACIRASWRLLLQMCPSVLLVRQRGRGPHAVLALRAR